MAWRRSVRAGPEVCCIHVLTPCFFADPVISVFPSESNVNPSGPEEDHGFIVAIVCQFPKPQFRTQLADNSTFGVPKPEHSALEPFESGKPEVE